MKALIATDIPSGEVRDVIGLLAERLDGRIVPLDARDIRHALARGMAPHEVAERLVGQWLAEDDDLARILSEPPDGAQVGSLEVPLGDRAYELEFAVGGRRRLGRRVAGLFPDARKVALLTNPTVGALYFEDVSRSIESVGLDVHRIDVPDGEAAKSLDVVAAVLDDLLVHRFERREPVIALGGGVVGDLAGFVASIYLRSVPFLQVPTTLLAQVDSSIGGKTGVNSLRGKNLIGSFHQPRHVLIDVEVLETLPEVEFRAGMAEVIKYGAIRDELFLDYLEAESRGIRAMEHDVLERIIYRSCANKAQVVVADEREQGERAVLNFGHTLGHAFETLGAYGGLRHGEAIAMGMVFAAWASASRGMCTAAEVARLVGTLEMYGLPVRPHDDVSPEACLEIMSLDKKVHQGQIRFVLLRRLGLAELTFLDLHEVAESLGEYLSI